jgi:hypothetical protein
MPSMDLEVFWHPPVALVDGTSVGLTYTCNSMERIHDGPGVYIFGRQFGDAVEPLYIGQAGNVRRRVYQHLNNNVRLMNSLAKAKNGTRVVLVGEWYAKQGQQARRVLRLIESALIKFALAEGHEILNDRGTRTPFHSLSMGGSRLAVGLFRPEMKLEE